MYNSFGSSRHARSLAYALNILKEPEYKKYIDAIYLFGSCARNEQTFASDVDLLVQIHSDTPQAVLLAMHNVVTPPEDLPLVELKLCRSEEFTSSKQFNINLERDAKLLWRRTKS